MSINFPKEYSVDFYSMADFLEFNSIAPWFLNATSMDEFVADVLNSGLEEPFTNVKFSPEQITNEGTNYREGLVANSLNARQRAMLGAIRELMPLNTSFASCNIYGLEQVTAFAERIRTIFPLFIGSEYLPDDAAKKAMPHIRHENLMALTFADNSFDVVFSNDVLEHVPDVNLALAEVYRVLKPNGIFVSTFPFSYGQYESQIKASIVDGELVHHMEPEYHGNPVDAKGSLVFEIPGWDILDRARAIGYSQSYVRATASKRYGYIGAEVPAIFLNIFQK
jgi:SAM-dependent methyltransferase